MKWSIPAKTFLLGEYSAVAELSALLVTTQPYFELSLTSQSALSNIHESSPAGKWWQEQAFPHYGLNCIDPYQGIGGMGASSAQFIGSYLAGCYLKNKTPDLNALLLSYYSSAWSGKGLKPSGYDVIAQLHHGCVFINKTQKHIETFTWPFKELSFFLIHTGLKLATHNHLQKATLPRDVEHLSLLVDKAYDALVNKNSLLFLDTINLYHQKLTQFNLVASHSLEIINSFKTQQEVLAIKGCGALGADIILIVTARSDADHFATVLHSKKWQIIATEKNISHRALQINAEVSL